MPEPVKRGQRYMPGLDGLRAVAVLGVIAYHLGFSWAPGGLLGVGVFFTLSGYLITDLLLGRARQLQRGETTASAVTTASTTASVPMTASASTTASVPTTAPAPMTASVPTTPLDAAATKALLREFWLRRARRLLPALFTMLLLVAVWVALVGPAQTTQFREAAAAAALYVANWQLVLQHVSYFARFAAPSPLGHLWSLGVEEQFYILWPLLLLLGLRFVKEASALRPRLAVITLVLAGASALEMALLYRPSFDPSRVYYGTDTRAFELLIGAALAMVWPSARLRKAIPSGAVRVLDGVGALCLLGILVMFWRVGEYSSFLYDGGFVLLSFATAILVATLAHPASRLGNWLGSGPLRWIGVRSYGIYLWHFPIIVLTSPSSAHGVSLPRAAAQVAATLLVAALSWRFIEQPARRGALGRLWRRLRSYSWRPGSLSWQAWAAAGGSVAVLAVAGVGLAGASLGGKAKVVAPDAGGYDASYNAGKTAGAGAAASKRRSSDGPSYDSSRTSCRAVIHIGDSTSEGLISTEYLPDWKHRIEYQYAHVGVAVQHYEIAGARSIVERYEHQPNAYEVAKSWKERGYHGCWVLALGTNDAADVAVGSKVGMRARIGEMMSVIGKEPVMWVNVKTLLSSGPYAERYMAEWDEALVKACPDYPTMRIFDWAGVVQHQWFIEDGIHFNTPGYRERARLITQGLAKAFPEGGKSSSCIVQ